MEYRFDAKPWIWKFGPEGRQGNCNAMKLGGLLRSTNMVSATKRWSMQNSQNNAVNAEGLEDQTWVDYIYLKNTNRFDIKNIAYIFII